MNPRCTDCDRQHNIAPGVYASVDPVYCRSCAGPTDPVELPAPPDGHRWKIEAGESGYGLVLVLSRGHHSTTPTEHREVGWRKTMVIPGRPITHWQPVESDRFDYTTREDITERAKALLANFARRQERNKVIGVYHTPKEPK